MKKNHEAEVSKTVQPLREGYIRALLSLEQSLATKGDFAGARVVQKERREMEQQIRNTGAGDGAGVEPKASTAEIAKDGSVLLNAASAELSGGAKLDDSQKHLSGWAAPGAAARWVLPPGLAEGGYEIEISFEFSASGSGANGSAPSTAPDAEKGAGLFQFREDFHSLSRNLKTTAVPESSTAPPLSPDSAPDANSSSPPSAEPASVNTPAGETAPLLVGPLRLRANASILEIKALNPEPAAAGLLRLRSLRLVPAASSTS